MKDEEEDLSRREVLELLGGTSGLFSSYYLQDYLTFEVAPRRFIEPDHYKVQEIANSHNDLTEKVDLGIDWKYKEDQENFKPAGDVLEHGLYGDCEDHAFVAASILEAKERDYKIVLKTGHTEVQFDTEDGVYEWSVGDPENPVPRSDNEWIAMYDLDDGWSKYQKDWNE